MNLLHIADPVLDGRRGKEITLFFEHEAVEIIKHFREYDPTLQGTQIPWRIHQLVKASVEAWRDVAYKKHGENWLQAAGKGPTAEELRAVAVQASKLRPDLFGGPAALIDRRV